MAVQTQRGRGFGGEIKGASSLTHKGEQYVPLIGDLDMVAQQGTAPMQDPHLLCPSLAAPLKRFKHLFGHSESV
jgi:hypothetical protein